MAEDTFLLQAENLVKAQILGFYKKTASLEELCRPLTDDCIWIGAGRQEFFPVLQLAKAYFLRQEASQSVPPFLVEKGTFHTRLLAPGMALVCGRYRVYLGRTHPLIDEWQRCTFIVQQQPDGTLGICHIHVSNPWYLMRGTELFPHAVFEEEERELAQELAKEQLPRHIKLSSQQKKILSYLSLGLTYDEIAAKLNITTRTVRYHLGQILNKFYVHNRQELLLHYIEILMRKEKEH